MELPEIVRRVGTIDRKKIVYIEEYVLQYLQIYQSEEEMKQERLVLYGRHECRESIHIYVIYFVCPENNGQEIEDETYEKMGYLRHKCQREQEEMALAGEMNIGAISGYYIFYDTNEQMKNYLGEYYEYKLRQEYPIISQAGIYKVKEEKTEISEIMEVQKSAELTALSRKKEVQYMTVYSPIRMAAICIIIAICAIAVTTINAPDKMSDFVQTIAQTNDWR